ncbi:PREDICTED: nose resistant to fluoxetine protein 6-like [Rhagoletis zephyria]|uniref:nose resistant to fluoxetine protein 6-like n=1 Tax=Rhagoletis zephyria TaxID=28612 RepID=UPI000811479C|nr:PREDICTED: nose resistant to fluoxetine protein 6-like [Rhagoletis zephyria]
MALVAFGALIMRYMGNGPEWLGATVFYDLYCKRNWWINLLYLQNFVHQNETCLTHTWYSAVDTQLYLLSPVFIILLYKMPKTAFALCFAIIAASIVGTWTLTVMNNYPAVSYFTDSITTQQLVGYYNSIYTKPYFRVGPYLVGILAAYAMLENSFKNFNLKTWYLVTGWILSLTTMAAIILALYPTHQGNILEIHLAATYSAIARILWACCLAWITFASQQQKNIISAFLSLKIWVPVSKLTYCVYLVHPVIIAFFYGSQTKPFDYSFLLMEMLY